MAHLPPPDLPLDVQGIEILTVGIYKKFPYAILQGEDFRQTRWQITLHLGDHLTFHLLIFPP